MKEIIMLAGPNGAGKTTSAMKLLPDLLQSKEFINADAIAQGLSPFHADKVAITAGKLMIKRIDELMQQNESFAFETTAASKSFLNTIKNAKDKGYFFTLIFLCLPSPELAISRVHIRIAQGGHAIPPKDIVRRFYRGLNNLINLYLPLADRATIIDAESLAIDVIAEKIAGQIKVLSPTHWNWLLKLKDEA